MPTKNFKPTTNWLWVGGIGTAIALINPRVRSQLGEFAVELLKGLAQPPAALPEPFGDASAGSQNNSAADPIPVYTPPVDQSLARLLRHPCVVLILGHRGGGKTALAVRLQELLRDIAPPYAVGLPQKAGRLLPDWYGLADDFDTIPSNAIVYVPESYRLFHARTTQTAQGRMIADLINLSRHRKHTLIFDVQNAAHLDRNIISEVDLVLVKEPGPFQEGFERSQFKGLMDSARAAFAGVGNNRKKRSTWVVAPGAGINGQLMENLLPSFWSDSLSRVFEDTSVGIGSGATGRPDMGRSPPANGGPAPLLPHLPSGVLPDRQCC